MDETNFSFCPHCGARVPSDAAFCNECGTSLNGYVPPGVNAPSNDPLSTPTILTLLYGIMMTSFGVLTLILGLSFTTEMWEEIIQMVPNYESIYPGFSASSVKELFLISGVFILMEGMLALMTYYLMKKRTNHKLAVIICAITSLLSVGAFGFPVGIISLAIGLYVTYQIYKNKAIFTS